MGLLALAATLPAHAQDAPARSLAVTATFDSTLSYLHTSPDGGSALSDVVLDLRPGVQVTSRSGRVRGSLNYSLDAIQHSDRAQSQGSALQNYLNAAFTAEAVPNWAFVDAAASITQQNLSAYGQQSYNGLDQNANRTEVASVSLSPYLRGSFGGLVSYEARLNGSVNNTSNSSLGDSTGSGGSLTLGSATRGYLGWSLAATRQRTGYRVGRSTTSDQVLASLIGRPDPELTLTVRGGQESNNVLDLDRRTYGNWGAQAVWTPTVRTTVDLGTDHRYYGDSHHVLVEHRFARSSFRFSSSRDVANPATNGAGSNQVITFYQLLDLRYLSSVPDPVQRDQVVRDQLRAAGIDPTQIALIGAGAVNSASTVINRQDLGWTYTGLRTTFSVLAFATTSSVIDTLATGVGNGDGNYRQRGYSVTVTQRLTPTTTATVSGSDLRTLSTDTLPGSDLRSATLNFTQQISRRVNGSLAARYTVQSGAANPYHEQSISASLGVRF